MDPIESFIRSNKKFSLNALINAHSRLSVLQLSKGGMVFEDVMQSLSMSGLELSVAELNAHAALVFESVLISHPGQKTLQMNRDVIANDTNFIRHILSVIYQRCGGQEFSAVEEFNMEAFMFLKGNHYKNGSTSSDNTDTQFNRGTYGVQSSNSIYGNNQQSYSIQQPSYQHNSKQRFNHGNDGVIKKYNRNMVDMEPELVDDYRSPMSRIEFEKSEPIVRLLAQVRKVGMDILFPQSTHDKILACIFVAIRSATTPAHRELIDMVMAVKESNHVSQLDSVSKTKVRGVLALLKHGELLVTQGSEGEPVRLYLAYGINSFKELRERHDAFLNRYMIEHHLFIPAILKSELVWQVDDDMRFQRIEAMNKLVCQLQLFFQGYQSKSAELDDVSAGNGFNASPSGKPTSLVGFGTEESRAPFSTNTMGSSFINNSVDRLQNDPFGGVSKSSRSLQPEDSNVSKYEPSVTNPFPQPPSLESSTYHNHSLDGESPDWINIGRKAAVQTRKEQQQQMLDQSSSFQNFGTNHYKNLEFGSSLQGSSRSHGGNAQHISQGFSASRINNVNSIVGSGQTGFRQTYDSRPPHSHNQFQQNVNNHYSSKAPSFSSNSMYNSNNSATGDNFLGSSSYIVGRTMNSVGGGGRTGTSTTVSPAAVMGAASAGGSSSSSYQFGGSGNGNTISNIGMTHLNSLNPNDRWNSQPSSSHYRDEFSAQSHSASFVNDLNKTSEVVKTPFSIGFPSNDDTTHVFDAENMLQSLPGDSSSFFSNPDLGSNFSGNGSFSNNRTSYCTGDGVISIKSSLPFDGSNDSNAIGNIQNDDAAVAEQIPETNTFFGRSLNANHQGDNPEVPLSITDLQS